MSISLNFELNDSDLEHFQTAAAAARKAAEGKSTQDIIDCASKLLADAQAVRIPDFILQRLTRLDDMIAMVRDEGWALAEADRDRVLSALVYFCDPQDVIPDNVAVLGYLDDAIMIELSVRELKHELDAYDDFCDFRQHQAQRRGVAPEQVGRADWLQDRREELVERMHQRRERDMGDGYGSSTGYGGSTGYSAKGGSASYTRTWRPGIFTFR